jgi:ATP-dependent DNA ligase
MNEFKYPMQPLKPHKICIPDPENWIMEDCYDGFRAILYNNHVYSRHNKSLDHLFPQSFLDQLNFQYPLDSELIHTSGRKCIQSLKSLKECNTWYNYARIFVFDIMVPNVILSDRKELIIDIILEKDLYSPIVILPFDNLIEESDIYNAMKSIEKSKLVEGIVLKKKNSLYYANNEVPTFTDDWIKIKKESFENVLTN